MKKLSVLGTLLVLTGCTVVPIPLNTALLPGLVPQSPPTHRALQTEIGRPVFSNPYASATIVPPQLSPTAPVGSTAPTASTTISTPLPNLPIITTGTVTSSQEMNAIGERIFRNETEGDARQLLRWHSQGNFADLGIGHLVWYPANQRGPYTETFPSFLNYVQSKNVPLPTWLANRPNQASPWANKAAFERAKDDPQLRELANFLQKTLGLQAAFMTDQLRRNLPTMVQTLPAPYRQAALNNFQVMEKTPGGVYPMLDYMVFQGSGTSSNERYNGLGWGLLQVLLNMETVQPGPNALAEFMRSANDSVMHRVAAAPAERREARMLSTWQTRIRTYKLPTRVGVASR
ncbi:hypothetical protein SAMN02745130_02281 [Thiothrix eikelboomii]|uniref:Uncharacterized protein n=1 Tax=Thiothrix eikelboomii TaxID=92487 RepID=A0A1T4WYM9_9GAMM|nr:hypothetical protein [Thiothrix eikelboomii]SKA82349.1 hypothetical protein SAMN02745130_02281 [Thiothrix eikelboomii]